MLPSVPVVKKKAPTFKKPRIGRPGYRVTKQLDPESGQRSLLFQIEYPEISEGIQPRHRFMSTYEQRVEPVDKTFQYVPCPHLALPRLTVAQISSFRC